MTHVLYTPKDFTDVELDRGNVLAKAIIDGGLGVCKKCGAAEVELEDYPTCNAYRKHQQQERRKRHDNATRP